MKIFRINSLFLSALLACSALMSENTFAQDPITVPEKNNTESPKVDDKTEKSKNSKAETKTPAQTKSSGKFNPTEEISEDLSVSFPVDI